MSYTELRSTKAVQAMRRKINSAKERGRMDGIEEAAQRIETADNTMLNQAKLSAYIRQLKGKP